MKTLYSFVSVVVLAIASSAASAAPVQLTTDQLDNVSAGARVTIAAAGGLAVGLGAYSTSGTSSSVGRFGVTSSAYNTSSAFVGAVTSSATSGACSAFSC